MDLEAGVDPLSGQAVSPKHVGLRYSPDAQKLYGMTDANWEVKHSTSGQVFMFMSAAICWSSKKQPLCAGRGGQTPTGTTPGEARQGNGSSSFSPAPLEMELQD